MGKVRGVYGLGKGKEGVICQQSDHKHVRKENWGLDMDSKDIIFKIYIRIRGRS